MKSVLDTSVLIDGSLSELEGELCVSAVSFAELHFGVLVANDDVTRAKRLARFSLLNRRFDPLPVDRTVAASFGELMTALHRKGRVAQSRKRDVLIAATAHAHGARLVTSDFRDFAYLDEFIDVVPAGR